MPAAAPWKDDIPPVGLAMACLFNTWFCTNCLLDYSVDIYALGAENPSQVRVSLGSLVPGQPPAAAGAHHPHHCVISGWRAPRVPARVLQLEGVGAVCDPYLPLPYGAAPDAHLWPG